MDIARRVWPWALLLAIGLFVVATQVLPPESFFAGDQGVKLLQVQAAARGGPWRPWIEYPARDVDPAFLHHGTFLEKRHGELVGIFPPLFAAATAPLHRWLGYPGLYVLSALGACLTFAASHRLAGSIPIALAAVLGTPVVFYGLEFWEHAPAVGLTTLAAAVVASATSSRADVLAGALVGCAAAFRLEAVLVWPALAGALWIAGEPLGCVFRRGGLGLVGLGAAAVPQALANQAVHGSPWPAQLAWNVERAGTRFETIAQTVAENVLPLHGRWVFVALLAAVAATAIASRRGRGAGHVSTTHAVIVGLLFLALGVPALRMLLLDARFGEAFGYRSLAHTWPLAALVLYRWPRRGDPARFPLAAGALILVLVSLLAPVPGGFQWGARLLLPAAPLLAVAGLLAVTRAEWAGRRVVVAGIVAVALAVQGVGVAFLGHSKRLYAGISRATEAATSAGDVIASDLFWFSQVTPKLHASRRFVLVQSAAELEAVASRAAALGLAGVVFVTSDDESRFAAPHRLADAWSAGTSTPLPGRGLRLTAYRPAEPPS